MRSGPTGGPDEVVCASGAVLVASNVSEHSKIALGTPCATVISRRDLGERVSVWPVLLFNVVATRNWVVHYVPCT